MLEVVRLVFRILAGWSGVSLIVAGLWIIIATWRPGRTDTRALFVAVTFVLLGVALLWGALNLI